MPFDGGKGPSGTCAAICGMILELRGRVTTCVLGSVIGTTQAPAAGCCDSLHQCPRPTSCSSKSAICRSPEVADRSVVFATVFADPFFASSQTSYATQSSLPLAAAFQDGH